jgi:hypothetical protein
LALCPAALAAPDWIPASRANYRPAHRPASAVRLVVVHAVEGSYWGAIAWFRSPRAHVSANYVVGRDGSTVQMVSERDVAWHAGNGWVNAHSVGIENEGSTHFEWQGPLGCNAPSGDSGGSSSVNRRASTSDRVIPARARLLNSEERLLTGSSLFSC